MKISNDTRTFREVAELYLKAGRDSRFIQKLVDTLGHKQINTIDFEYLRRGGRETYPDVTESTLRRQWFTPYNAIVRFSNPSNLALPRSSPPRQLIFTPKQADQFICAVGEGEQAYVRHNTAIAEFIFGTGAVVREALAMMADDVDLACGTANLQKSRSGQIRQVTLPARTLDILKHHSPPSVGAPLFRKKNGDPYSLANNGNGSLRYGVSLDWWAPAAKKVGLDAKAFSPQVARYSWATWLYAQTQPGRMFRESGWATYASFERFIKFATPDLGQEAAAYGWRWNSDR